MKTRGYLRIFQGIKRFLSQTYNIMLCQTEGWLAVAKGSLKENYSTELSAYIKGFDPPKTNYYNGKKPKRMETNHKVHDKINQIWHRNKVMIDSFSKTKYCVNNAHSKYPTSFPKLRACDFLMFSDRC